MCTFEKQQAQARSARRANFTLRGSHLGDRKFGGLLGGVTIESAGIKQSDKHIFLPSVVKETFINVFISGKKYDGASQFCVFI